MNKDQEIIFDLAVALDAGVYCPRCKEKIYDGIKEHFKKHQLKGDSNEETSQ
jgi:hypothetical protein